MPCLRRDGVVPFRQGSEYAPNSNSWLSLRVCSWRWATTSRRRGLSLMRPAFVAIVDNTNFFKGHETAAHNAVEQGHEGIDLRLHVHDFEDDGKSSDRRRIFAVCSRLVAPKPIGLRSTVAPARPVSRALSTMASYRGWPSWRSDSPMKMRRRSDSVGRCMMVYEPFKVLSHAAQMCPSHTARKQSANVATELAPARNHSPSRTSASVCRLNDEYVV